MTGPGGTCVNITLFGARIAFALRGAGDLSHAGREDRKNGVKAMDRIRRTANHQTITPLQPPDTPGSAAINVMDLFCGKLPRAADVILVERIAAINDDVIGFQHVAKALNCILGYLSSRQHDPDGARRRQRVYQFLQRGNRA